MINSIKEAMLTVQNNRIDFYNDITKKIFKIEEEADDY